MIHHLKRVSLIVIAPLLALTGYSFYRSPNAASSSTNSHLYNKVPSAASSKTYSVKVNGQPVQVELYGTNTGNVSFARFSFSGTANVVVTVDQPVTNYVLSPKNDRIAAKVSGNAISFTLANPQRLVLHQVNKLREELFLLADAQEINPPQPGVSGVTDALTEAGIDNTNSNDDSAGINQAISKLAGRGGGTLYFPAGVYKIGSSVNMKSNVTVYLAPGAVFQVPSNYHCCFRNQGVINFSDLTNARLMGRGVINGNAVHIPQANRDFHMIYTENVHGIEIDNVLLLDEGVTGIRLVDAHNSAVHNIEIIANNPTTESDGIDFDSSDNILVDNAFIYSSDDNTSQGGGTGVRHVVKNIYNITVQNSVFYNARTGAAFKIGTTDPQHTISNETFRNINVVSTIQLAAFYPTFGANIQNISFSNIRAETVKDRPFEFQAVVPTWSAHWNGKIGYIRGINFTNVTIDSAGRPSDFIGYSSTQNVSGITFTNFQQNGIRVRDLGSAQISLGPFVTAPAFLP